MPCLMPPTSAISPSGWNRYRRYRLPLLPLPVQNNSLPTRLDTVTVTACRYRYRFSGTSDVRACRRCLSVAVTTQNRRRTSTCTVSFCLPATSASRFCTAGWNTVLASCTCSGGENCHLPPGFEQVIHLPHRLPFHLPAIPTHYLQSCLPLYTTTDHTTIFSLGGYLK